jgi:hypothetical protein
LYADSFLGGYTNFPACCIDTYHGNFRSLAWKTGSGPMIRPARVNATNGKREHFPATRKPSPPQFKKPMHDHRSSLARLLVFACFLTRLRARFFARCHLNDQGSCLLLEVKALDGPQQDLPVREREVLRCAPLAIKSAAFRDGARSRIVPDWGPLNPS